MESNMDKENKMPMPENTSCKCGKFCGMGYGHRHYALRWLLGLVILGVIFCIGIKVGELKSGYGWGHQRGGYNMMSGRRPIMRAYPMGSGSAMMNGSSGTTLPKTATTTPVK